MYIDHSRISFSIEESFGERRYVEFNWVIGTKVYVGFVQEGPAQRRCSLTPEASLELSSIVRSLALPATPGGDDGLDGTSYELGIGATFATHYRWWQALPDAWHPLRSIIDPIIETLGWEQT